MDDLYRKAARRESSWCDPYHEAVQRERARDQQLWSQNVLPDEASWARLERRCSDRTLYRWCQRTLLQAGHWLLTVLSRGRAAAATSGLEITRRPGSSARAVTMKGQRL